MTYADKRAKDPVIVEILKILRERNIQNPDYTAIKKILEEGADGRYLEEIKDHTGPAIEGHMIPVVTSMTPRDVIAKIREEES